MKRVFCFLMIFGLLAANLCLAEKKKPLPKPLRALLITGGCCHDYANQKDILKQGLERRINIKIDHAHSPDKSTKPSIAIYGNADYAKGYDLVIHDECSAGISDPKVIDGVLAPHHHKIRLPPRSRVQTYAIFVKSDHLLLKVEHFRRYLPTKML